MKARISLDRLTAIEESVMDGAVAPQGGNSPKQADGSRKDSTMATKDVKRLASKGLRPNQVTLFSLVNVIGLMVICIVVFSLVRLEVC